MSKKFEKFLKFFEFLQKISKIYKFLQKSIPFCPFCYQNDTVIRAQMRFLFFHHKDTKSLSHFQRSTYNIFQPQRALRQFWIFSFVC